VFDPATSQKLVEESPAPNWAVVKEGLTTPRRGGAGDRLRESRNLEFSWTTGFYFLR